MVYLRDNTGVFEYSLNGTTWTAVGSGGVTDHTLLTNIGTNTHAQIDTHIADTGIHGGGGVTDHTLLTNIGTNTHAQIDTHIADTGIHGGGGGGGSIIIPGSSPYNIDITECLPGNLIFTNMAILVLPSTITLTMPADAAIIRIFSTVYGGTEQVQIAPNSTDEVIRLLGVVGGDGGSIVLDPGSSCLLYGWDYNWWVIDVSGTCAFL